MAVFAFAKFQLSFIVVRTYTRDRFFIGMTLAGF